MNKAPQQDPQLIIEQFKDSLKDVVAIAEKLQSHCPTVTDLITICQLAIEHDAQLNLVMSLMQAKK